MKAQLRIVVALFCMLFAVNGACLSQSDPRSDAYAWLQYGADGHPHARVIPSDRAGCPAATADERGVAMTVKVVASAGFDRVLCDATLPLDARNVRIAGATLPPLAQHISRIVVLGDTGCRINGREIQDCNDPLAWPFARIAQSIARESPRPDLIVHVGNYQNRESPCPPGDRRCAGSPFGDIWKAWAVDFFEPGAPLLRTAPIVWVRGNDETCELGGLGWSRYLAPEPSETCRRHESPAVATFADVSVVNVDSAAGDASNPDPAAFAGNERFADGAADSRETILVTHRPPPAYLAAHAAGDPDGPRFAAIVAGHLELFAALPFAGAPPADARLGYAVFDRVPGGWSMSERDPNGSEHRRCAVRGRTVHC